MIKFRPLFFSLAVLALALWGCEKPEDPMVLPPPPQDSVVSEVADLGQTYQKVIYYQFKTGNKTEYPLGLYDLAFETDAQNHQIWLNSAKYMFVWRTGSKNFNQTFDLNQADWKYDVPDYNPDSSYIGDWRKSPTDWTSDSMVYVIDRGKILHNFSPERYIKFVVLRADENSFTVRFAANGSTDVQEVTVQKDPEYAYVYLSFDQGGKMVNAAPKRYEWDGVFRQYSAILYDQPLSTRYYLVRGFLLNPKAGIQAAAVKKNYAEFPAFPDLSLDNMNRFAFTPSADVVGYDWKTFDLNSLASYDIEKNWYYLVRTPEQDYYKLQFTGFYNNKGERGYIQFDQAKLY